MSELTSTTTETSFLPFGQCFSWSPDIFWLLISANLVIVVAFILLPIALYLFATRSQYKFPDPDLIYLFMAFIFFSGLSHAVEIYTIWEPSYRLIGWAKAITASISIVTALVFLSKLPELLKNPSFQKKYQEMEEAQRELEARLNQMNSLYEASLGREERIVQLKKEINQELAKQGLSPRYRIHED